jgi:hypothetical protein
MPPRHGSISETSFGLSAPALVRRTSSENSHGYNVPLLQRQSSSSSDNGMLAASELRRAASMNSCNSTRELNQGLEKVIAKYKNTEAMERAHSNPVYDHLQLEEYDQEQESRMRQQAEHEEKNEIQKLEENMEESFKQLTWQTVRFKSSDNSPDRSAKVGRIQKCRVRYFSHVHTFPHLCLFQSASS